MVVVSRWRLLLGAACVSIAGAVTVGWLILGTEGPPGPHPAPAPLPDADADITQAVHEALEAWARFALSGDLQELAGHFHPDGPQYAQLRTEASGMHHLGDADSPYRFDIHRVTVQSRTRSHATALVDTSLSRQGEATRRYQWLIKVRLYGDDGWVVWTVATAMQRR